MSFLSGYARLVELAEQRLALLESGRFAEAAEVGETQLRQIEELPFQAPPEAEPLLRRLEELFAAGLRQVELASLRTAHELGLLRRARPALLAYVDAPEHRTVDRRG